MRNAASGMRHFINETDVVVLSTLSVWYDMASTATQAVVDGVAVLMPTPSAQFPAAIAST